MAHGQGENAGSVAAGTVSSGAGGAGGAALLAPRALVIGVGGTGREILTKVRRRVCDRLGGVEGVLPWQKYLYFDSSEADVGKDERKLDDPKAVDVPAGNRHRLTVDVDVTNPSGWLSARPHLAGWCPSSAVVAGRIHMGAGGVRARGRLALVANYGIVQAVLQGAVNELLEMHNGGDDDGQDGPGIRMGTAPIVVFLVGSAAGGTCSGSLIDLAYIVRDIGGPSVCTVGVLLLPRHQDEGIQAQYLANAYGMLKEINHFWYASTKYSASFGLNTVEGEIESVFSGPFHWLYLVGTARNGLGVNDVLGLDEALEICAEAIYHELMGDDVAVQATVRREDFETKVQAHDYVGSPQWYLSVGISGIRFPKDRATRACTWLLVERLLERYLQPGPSDVKWQESAKGALKDKVSVDSIYNSVAGDVREQCERSWRQAYDDLRTDIGRVQPPDPARYVRDWLDGVYSRRVLRPGASRGTPLREMADEILGDDLRGLRDRFGTAVEQVWKNLCEAVTSSVGSAKNSISGLLDMLDAFLREIGGIQAKCERKWRVLANEERVVGRAEYRSSVEYWQRRSDEADENFHRVAQSAVASSLLVARRSLFDRALARCVRTNFRRFAAIEEAYAWQLAAEVAGTLHQKLNRVKSSVERARDTLEAICKEAQRASDRYNQARVDTRMEELWDPKTDREKAYKRHVTDEVLAQLDGEFFGRLGAQNLLGACEAIARDEQDTQEVAYSVCLPTFQTAFDGVDVLDLFWARYPNREARSRKIRELVRQSTPPLEFDPNYTDYDRPTPDNGKRIGWIGLAPGPHADEFYRTAEAAARHDYFEPKRLNLNARWYVVIRQEVAAFPLAVLTQLGSYQRAVGSVASVVHARQDVKNWQPLRQPPALEQFETWKRLAWAWLLSLDPPGWTQDCLQISVRSGTGPDLYLVEGRLRYEKFGSLQEIAIGPVELGQLNVARSEVLPTYGLPGQKPPQLMPTPLSATVQQLAGHQDRKIFFEAIESAVESYVKRSDLKEVAWYLGANVERLCSELGGAALEVKEALLSAVGAFAHERGLGEVNLDSTAKLGERLQITWNDEMVDYMTAGGPQAQHARGAGAPGAGQGGGAALGEAAGTPSGVSAEGAAESVEASAMPVCPKCGTRQLSAAAKFCHQCGQSLRQCCPGCGQEVPREARYCSNCGKQLA